MKLVYQFNPVGKLINTHFNVNEAVIKTGIKDQTIRTSITRQGLAANAFYFSFDKNFKVPIQAKPIKPMITTRAEYLFVHEV